MGGRRRMWSARRCDALACVVIALLTCIMDWALWRAGAESTEQAGAGDVGCEVRAGVTTGNDGADAA